MKETLPCSSEIASKIIHLKIYQSKRQAKKNYIFTKPTLKTDSGVKLGAGILTKDYTWDKQKRERETERENILSPLFQNPLTQTLTTVDHFPQTPSRGFITPKNQITLENVLVKTFYC